MQQEIFTSFFKESIVFLSNEWKRKYAELLNDEHWHIIGERIFSFAFKNKIEHNPLPIFNEEIITDYTNHYQYFGELKSIIGKDRNKNAQLIARMIQKTPFESLLIILGLRKTSATITDENAIPPIKEELLKSSFRAYNQQKSKAARAREKHISRNKIDTFWGKIEGTPAQKEKAAKAIVEKIIDEKTWWNVFTHYKHDVVYEVRVASGQGIRWKKDGLELIGFLEPFIC